MHILLRQITVTAITQDLKQAPHARRCRRQFWQNPAGLPARRVLRKYRGPFLEFRAMCRPVLDGERPPCRPAT